MKENYREFLSMCLCLTALFSFSMVVRDNFVSAYPLEVFFLEPHDGDMVSPNENGSVLIRTEYTGSECPYYFEIFIDGELRTRQHSYSGCTTSIFYYWPTLEYNDGYHSLHAYVTYEMGTVIAESDMIWVNLNNPESPQVQIKNPLNNETVGDGVYITAKVTVDPEWVYDTRVKFTVDGSLIGWVNDPTSQENPYTFYYTQYWDSTTVPDGQHTISAKVYDEFSRTREISITVSVQQQSQDGPPSVEILHPLNGDVVNGTEGIEISASDDIGVSRVELEIDDQLVQTFYSEPYQFSWDTTSHSDGLHTIEAIVYDTISQSSSHSINVEVINQDLPPEVMITNPQDGEVVSGLVTMNATASDDSGVVKVVFYVDGSVIGTATFDPYSCPWDTTAYSDGIHIVRAVVYDTQEQTSHDEITITVHNETNRPPVACFAYNPRNPVVGHQVNFNASCSSDADSDPLDYSWDFGDGTAGNGRNTRHRYSAAGSYNVVLTVNDGKGGVSSTPKTVIVQARKAGTTGGPLDLEKQIQPLASTRIPEAKSLQQQAYNLLKKAIANYLDVSEVQALIERAAGLLRSAEERYSCGNYIAANTLAVEAMTPYQQAIEILQILLE